MRTDTAQKENPETAAATGKPYAGENGGPPVRRPQTPPRDGTKPPIRPPLFGR